MKFLMVMIFIATMFVSCGKQNPQSQPEDITIITSSFFDTFTIKKNTSQQGWDSLTSMSLYENMKNPALASLFEVEINQDDLIDLKCSNFNSLSNDEKSLFYIVFLAAVAKLESDFDPKNMTYDSTHRNWNVGLLQIDTDSALRHAPEAITNDYSVADLKDPNTNLYAGLYILKNQIIGKYRPEITGRLLPSKSYYREVLNNSHRVKFLKAFFINHNLLSFCDA